jgi:hypothetical protein
MISNVLAGTDWILLSLPGVRNLGGTAVLYGHPDKEEASPPRDTIASQIASKNYSVRPDLISINHRLHAK